jgi:molecular chaperone DnaK (HSP70)
MPAGFPQVDVTFLVNENGMLIVSAKEQRSGQQASVTVQAAHGLSPDEVDKLVLESVEHAREDFAARQLVEFKNKGEADVRYTRKMLAEAGDRLTAAEHERINSAIQRVESAIAAEDVGALRPAVAALQEATSRLATEGLNAVVQQVLAGKTEAELKAGNL